jgi:hypothetical protein
MEVKAKFLNAFVMGLILGTIYYNQDDSQRSAKNILGLFFILNMYQVRTLGMMAPETSVTCPCVVIRLRCAC